MEILVTIKFKSREMKVVLCQEFKVWSVLTRTKVEIYLQILLVYFWLICFPFSIYIYIYHLILKTTKNLHGSQLSYLCQEIFEDYLHTSSHITINLNSHPLKLLSSYFNITNKNGNKLDSFGN